MSQRDDCDGRFGENKGLKGAALCKNHTGQCFPTGPVGAAAASFASSARQKAGVGTQL